MPDFFRALPINIKDTGDLAADSQRNIINASGAGFAISEGSVVIPAPERFSKGKFRNYFGVTGNIKRQRKSRIYINKMSFLPLVALIVIINCRELKIKR